MTRRESFALPMAGGLVVRGEALLPESATTAVILCHGFKGFSRWAFFPHLAQRIAEAGLRAISFNFSGSGVGADGETFTELEAFERNSYTQELRDLAAVQEEGTRRGWLGARYGLFGHSRGGGVTILHAARSRAVGALVTWSAIAEAGRWSKEEIPGWRTRGYIEVPNTRTGQIFRLGTQVLDEVERLGRGELDILAAASRIDVPWLIVHGSADETVSVGDARRLHAAASVRSRRVEIEGASHTFDVRHPMSEPSPTLAEAVRATVAFLRSALA